MSERTIPEPHEDELMTSLFGISNQAQRFGLDLEDPNVQGFVEHMAKVKAQMMAETRWLRNIINNKTTQGE